MSRILVTGSAQGIGAEVARTLVEQGHEIAVHGRNPQRADAALAQVPGASSVVVGEFDSLDSTRELAAQANEAGPWDVVVHNAAIGPDQPERRETADGLEQMFQVNVVAPYLLTCLTPVAPRVIYVGSDSAEAGRFHLEDVNWRMRPWTGEPWLGLPAYSDSKLYLGMLGREVAARHPVSVVNVVHPGWVQTSMGGPNAAIPVEEGADSLVWLATSSDEVASATGQFIHKRAVHPTNPLVEDAALRGRLMDLLAEITGERLPAGT